ncbi:hypothetical protein [Massilibacteroides vaginae]|uniref:hypothetical protein n=1 Tax=Massilibacteroides vaginae TaxID=1673718 RepID=UPI000A1CED74|nr:hypothetical protein [Massilibacteroides vaginae]
MEPITLISTAIALATPYLIKAGESVAEKIGEDIWNLIKKPFAKGNSNLSIDINNKEEKERLINLLIEEVSKNSSFKDELEVAVNKSQEELNAYYQQNINNNGQIEKQINIQNNTGNIQM